MELIITTLIAAAPSLAAILGIIFTVIKAKGAFEKIKRDATLDEIKEELKKVSAENKELVRVNRLYLDIITKIDNYADIKKGV